LKPTLFPAAPPTHAELVQRAVRWLRGFHKCSHAYGELVTSSSYIPDAIGWRWAFSIMVECKVSRADFFADRKKLIHRNPDSHPGEERWYLTPPGLVRPEEVPEGWYLAEAHERAVKRVTQPPSHYPDRPNDPDSWVRLRHDARAAAGVPYLLSALRRHECGAQFDAERGRFETIDEGRARRAGAP
jgi:hypothetical protein